MGSFYRRFVARWAELGSSGTGRFILVLVGAFLLFLSFYLPYWDLYLKAPQYPQGLRILVYMDHAAGDVSEVDLLNHYIGMVSLDSAARLERRFAWYVLLALSVGAVLFVPFMKRAHRIYYLPPVLFLVGFVGDLFYWLYEAGHKLNPDAPVHIKPFTPILIGRGKIGQFETSAVFGSGFWLAAVATIMLLALIALKPRAKKSFWAILFLLLCKPAHSAEPNYLQGLIDRAPRGGLVRVPPGIFEGHFFVRKPLRIKGSPGTVLDGRGEGTVLKVLSPDVSIEGLVIQNSGAVIGAGDSAVTAEQAARFVLKNCTLRNTLFGVQVLSSPASRIENNDISGRGSSALGRRGDLIKVWYSPEVLLRNNRIRHGRDVLVWYSDRSVVEGNSIEAMRYGLHYMYSHDNLARHNTFSMGSVGVYDMYSNGLRFVDNVVSNNRGPSGYGLAFKEADRAVLLRNRLLFNRVGLYLDNTPLSPSQNPMDTTRFEFNRVAGNDIGVAFVGSGSGSVFIHNDFVDNWQQVSGTQSAHSHNVWVNNYWSDYRGADPGRTGIGVIAYRADNPVDRLTDRFESFKLFCFGPIVQAITLAQRLIPWIPTSANAVDPAPTMRWNTLGTTVNQPAWIRLVLALFSAALLVGIIAACRFA